MTDISYKIIIDNIEFFIEQVVEGSSWFSIYRGDEDVECIFSDDDLNINHIPNFVSDFGSNSYIEWRKKELTQYGECYKKIKTLLILI